VPLKTDGGEAPAPQITSGSTDGSTRFRYAVLRVRSQGAILRMFGEDLPQVIRARSRAWAADPDGPARVTSADVFRIIG
jgi:hypothetical protein